ncbi:invertase recombinase-like protein [Corallococcus interemptor]|uniref:invertase recombinase-like protein n=1 Tax=Corallococcus interemptor TaxID=2316720 RepID=UPI003CFFDF06
MKLFRVCLTSLLVLAVACGDSTSPETPDAGQSRPDAGAGVPDAGSEQDDAGTEPADAGSEPPDSGTEPTDAGTEPTDAGTEPTDAGSGATDAGSEPTDAGSGTDAGTEPSAGNVIDNGGFEQWPNALPALWSGGESNIEEVQKVTTQVFEGVNAARLINTSGTHRRFTTAAKSMPAGKYSCTYQARGTGEVRNAWFGTTYSSYSGYTSLSGQTWTQVTYNFNLANPIFDTFELIFSVRNTTGEHVVIDNVRCVRAPEACDQISCEEWARCDNATATCQPLSGRCDDASDCREWQACDATHTCVTAADRCTRHADCAGTPETPLCDTASHLCIEGDPCAGVTCSNPATSCNPSTGVCELAEGACFTTYDCKGALPACDPATRRCVAAEHSANIIRNGGFESWSTRAIPYYGNNYVPDYWYGLDNGITDPGSEIKPSRLARYTNAVHGGSAALQFVVPIQTAERFTTEKFNVAAGNYSCSYRVRGHGSIRHRSYSSGGWSPQTDFITVDSDEWQPVFFKFTGNVRDWRLFFYPSRSVADRDHLQVDDVVCTKD